MVKRGLQWIAAGAAAVLVVFWIWSSLGNSLSANFDGPSSEQMSLATLSRMDPREFLEPPPISEPAVAGSRIFDPHSAVNGKATPEPLMAVHSSRRSAAHDHSRRRAATRYVTPHRTHRRSRHICCTPPVVDKAGN